MKKTLFVITLLLVFLIGCQTGNQFSSVNTISTTEEQTMTERTQLTPEQLITMANLPQDMYDTEFLQRFISFYDIAKDNVYSLNIELLLSGFDELDDAIDVRSFFSDTPSESVPANPEQIVAVAFYENINTGIKSVYCDFDALTCYKAADIDLFFDLNQVGPITLSASEAESIRNQIVALGVLDWKDAKSEEEVADPQTMCIAIRFEDGSLFRVSASGLLYEDGPAHYSEVRDLLLGD